MSHTQRIFSLDSLLCRISTAHISSTFVVYFSTLSGGCQFRKPYHSDTAAQFRAIRLPINKLPKVPHTLKATPHASKEHTFPVGPAGNHNAPDPFLSLPLQVGRPDNYHAYKAPKYHGGSASTKFLSKNLSKNLLAAARVGDTHNAFNFYLEFTKIAKPDVEMADILIKALCRGTLQAPPRHRILQALQVYNNLLETERQNPGDDKGFFNSQCLPTISEQRHYTGIYNTLLRALSAPLSVKSSRETGKEVQEEYTKISTEILAAMEARGLVPDNRTVCSILLLRLRRATNHEEAFEIYRSIVTELEAAHARGSTVFVSDSESSELQPQPSGTQPLLDLRGYRMVLNAFGKLSFPSVPVAPAPLWFAIVNDMRERGHAVTVEDYTIYLGGILAQTSPFTLHRTAIGFASPQDEEARMEAMMASVKHVHKQIALDVHIVPDTTLMNTLLNVYQHLGAFDNAMKIFNTMWLSGRLDDVTPVIMFDACGYARRSREANLIWCKLVEKGWQFDKHTLDTWVECLCRLGNVEAACKFVCIYMGRDKAGYSSRGDTRPDVQTCLILLKLSWIFGQNLDVKDKIRTHLPHIWKSLTAHYT